MRLFGQHLKARGRGKSVLPVPGSIDSFTFLVMS